ncbi:MAG: DNA mismatch repair protein MutS2 [Spirosomataceae bacterium]
MLYPNHIESKIGFDKIREALSEACNSSLGRSFVDKMRFSDRYDNVKKMVEQTNEFRMILMLESGFPNQNYLDVSQALKRASIEGAFLDTEQFFDIKLSLTTIQQIIHFFKNKETTLYTQLRQLLEMAIPYDGSWSALINQIDRVIDERGQVRDNASPELLKLRKQITSEQNAVRRTLERIYRTAKNSGWIGESMTLTVRDGRLVIPLLAEHKRKLKGFVHDESSTGQMAFVEPAEVLEANNEIRDLEIRERREVIKILENLTNILRPRLDELKPAYQFLGLMDFIRAKAKFAMEIDAVSPLLVEGRVVEWSRAYHPLLYLSHKKVGKSIVPLTIKLDPEDRILIVSGPNAGGKSVLLKTLGLLQYMLQCGLLVPMMPDSKVGIFKNIFIDIGDEQSIENDLSTYSSHLTNMKHFLLYANKQTLFLIDEFGSGTEPNLGGSIAESILEDLVKSKALGVINTHYTNLKIFANKNDGLLNGAMKFDAEKLAPLYELEIGKPGSSFALEVAEKIGLPKEVIDRAEDKVGTQQVDFEKLIKELEIEKKVFSDRNRDLFTRNKKLEEQIDQYNRLKAFIDIEQKKIILEAKDQAKSLVKNANKEIENTIRKIKESKAEKVETLAARETLKKFEQKELTVMPSDKPKPIKKTADEWQKSEGEIKVGSYVQIKGQTAIGEVLSVKNKDVEVAIGQLKTKVKLNRLEKVTKAVYKEATKQPIAKKAGGMDMSEKMSNFSFNLDVRGKRSNEALTEVDNLMDDALLLGYNSLRIVHGKGDGILRTIIRNHLKNYKQVASVTDEHADRGGQGVTLVEMK